MWCVPLALLPPWPLDLATCSPFFRKHDLLLALGSLSRKLRGKRRNVRTEKNQNPVSLCFSLYYYYALWLIWNQPWEAGLGPMVTSFAELSVCSPPLNPHSYMVKQECHTHLQMRTTDT